MAGDGDRAGASACPDEGAGASERAGADEGGRALWDAPTGERDLAHLGADAWGALLRVHAAVVPMLDRDLQTALRVPLAWYDVLLELDHAPGRRLRMSDLGERVVLSRTRVSRLVDEMADADLVRREANPDDRRSAYAVLTEQGRSALNGAAPVYLSGIREHFAGVLTMDELSIIKSALDRVLQRAHDGSGFQRASD